MPAESCLKHSQARGVGGVDEYFGRRVAWVKVREGSALPGVGQDGNLLGLECLGHCRHRGRCHLALGGESAPGCSSACAQGTRAHGGVGGRCRRRTAHCVVEQAHHGKLMGTPQHAPQGDRNLRTRCNLGAMCDCGRAGPRARRQAHCGEPRGTPQHVWHGDCNLGTRCNLGTKCNCRRVPPRAGRRAHFGEPRGASQCARQRDCNLGSRCDLGAKCNSRRVHPRARRRAQRGESGGAPAPGVSRGVNVRCECQV